VRAAVLELDPRAGDEILDGSRDEHLARPRSARHSRSDVDGQPGDLLPDALALAGVDPRPHLETELGNPLHDLAGTGDRPRGPVEAREEPVPGRVDLDSAEALELTADGRVVLLEQLSPGAVAKLHRPFGRADQIR
jgi:hypothetical protein